MASSNDHGTAMAEPSFGSILTSHGSRPDADEVAVRYGECRISWRDLDQRSNERAMMLLNEGVQPDDLVAIALPNGIAHHEWTFAAWKAGATPCILSPRSPREELAATLALAKPRVFVGPSAASVEGIAVLEPESSAGQGHGAPPPDLAATNWKAIGSGGSTGRPKLIVDHSAARMTEKIRGLISTFGLPVNGAMMCPGPLQHNAGFLFSNVGLLARTSVVGMERFDAEQCLALAAQHRVQWLFLVPTMMHRIWSLPAAIRERYDLSSLQRVVHLAAACPVWLKQAWIDWLGPDRILEGYAGTECPGTMITGAEWLRKKGSVGRVRPGTITIRGLDGEVCAPGEVGEIFFSQDAVQRFHYIGAQPRLDADGRLSLGDMGRLDDESYLFLADRRTDLIIRGGANIYPAEVEAALVQHPAVADAITIGLPSDELGHRVHAIIEITRDGVIEIEDLDTFVRPRLASYKCPESYDFVSAPLRDEAGKARRGALRDERLQWLQDERVNFLQYVGKRG